MEKIHHPVLWRSKPRHQMFSVCTQPPTIQELSIINIKPGRMLSLRSWYPELGRMLHLVNFLLFQLDLKLGEMCPRLGRIVKSYKCLPTANI